MPLNFVPQRGAAVDNENGLTIFRPRMLPAEKPDDIEYQYTVYLNGSPFDGLGLFGTEEILIENGEKLINFTLDFGRDWVINSIFSLKNSLENKDDDFSFLTAIAKGLIATFVCRKDNDENIRYMATTKASLLNARDIKVPSEISQNQDRIVLASVFIPAHH